jgi:hypothetical protein
MVHTAEVIFAWTLWALERLSVNSTPLTNSRFINDGVGGRIPLALQHASTPGKPAEKRRFGYSPNRKPRAFLSFEQQAGRL